MSGSASLDRVRRAAACLEFAACNLDQFEYAFSDAAKFLGTRAFYMVRENASLSLELKVSPTGDSPELLRSYITSQWNSIDTWTKIARPITRKGEIAVDFIHLPRTVRSKDAFFQEFCREQDLAHFAAWEFQIEDQRWGYTLIRDRGNPFTSDDLKSLQLFRPIADRAALLAMCFRNQRIRGLADGLEASGRPSLVLDHAGKVAYLTSLAHGMLGGAFDIRSGALYSAIPEVAGQLRRLSAWFKDRRAPLPTTLQLSSPGSSARIIGMPLRIPRETQPSLPGAALILMLIDLGSRPNLDAQILKDIFGLSTRETTVARLLAAGHDIAEISDMIGLRTSTVRQIVKLVLAKTGQHRQAGLVALIAGLALGK